MFFFSDNSLPLKTEREEYVFLLSKKTKIEYNFSF